MNRTQKQILEECNYEDIEFQLRESQIESINYYLDGNDVFYVGPTGIGKTMLINLAAKYEWEVNRKKTVVIGLLKTLTKQQAVSFNQILPTLIKDGDHKQETEDFLNKDWVIACMTPETFDNIMNNEKKRNIVMEDVGLIATDEAHTVGDANRGHRMENYLIISHKHFKNVRYIYLSATVGNPTEYNQWLKSKLVYVPPELRPVPLEVRIMPYREKTYHWNYGIPDRKANFNLRISLVNTIIRRLNLSYWVIFVTSRIRTSQIADALVGDRKHHSLHDLIDNHKIAYHHAGMSAQDREYVEYMLKAGKINIVIGTPTLAVGVNFMFEGCIIFDVEQYSALRGNEPIGRNRLQQSIGRAGRPGMAEKGYAFILTPERLKATMTDYVVNPLIVKSQLKPRLNQKILQWIVGNSGKDFDSLLELTEQSYADITEEELQEAINWLITFGFIEEEKEWDYEAEEFYEEGYNGEFIYNVTPIGYHTVSQDITPESVVKWQSQVCNIQNNEDFNELFIRFGSVNEYLNLVTIRKEDELILNIASKELGELFPEMENDSCGLCVTCKLSRKCEIKKFQQINCIDYISIKPKLISNELFKAFFLTFHNDLEEKYEFMLKRKYNDKTKKMDIKRAIVPPGDKTTMLRAGEMIFRAASVIFDENEKLSETLKSISIMCEAGTLKKELIELMKIPRIGFKRAKQLFDSGIKTIGEFVSISPGKIVKSIDKMSLRKAKAIQLMTKKMIEDGEL